MMEKYGNYSRSMRLLAGRDASSVTDEIWQEACNMQRMDENTRRHWEFLAIALLECCDSGGKLAEKIKFRLTELLPLFNQKVYAKNFSLMQRIVLVRLADRMLRAGDLDSIGLRQQDDGCLLDCPEGPSTQYHAYILLLIMRWGDRDDPVLRKIVRLALRWLEAACLTYGDANALGRGRFQIFGYVAMMKILELQAVWGGGLPDSYANKVKSRLIGEAPDGALSARWTGPHRDGLLHGYNTPDDYAAFSQFWLAETPIIIPSAADVDDSIWLHTLDFEGSVLLANTEGVLAAVTPRPLSPPMAVGNRKLAWRLWRDFSRSEKFPENILPRVCKGHIASFGSSKLRMALNAGVRTLTFTCEDNIGAWHSPIVWLPEILEPVLAFDISTEAQIWRWARDDKNSWVGRSFRAFGRGQITWTW